MSKKILTESDIQARTQLVSARLIGSAGESTRRRTQDRKSGHINLNNAAKLGKIAGVNKITNRIIMESNPQLTRALEILSGLIVTPNGGTAVILTPEIDVADKLVDKKTKAAVVEHIKDLITSQKFTKNLGTMVYKILSIDGADGEIYIPNASQESLMDKTGLEAYKQRMKEGATTIKEERKREGSKKEAVTFVEGVGTLRDAFNRGMILEANLGMEAESPTGFNITRTLQKRKMMKQAPQLMLDVADIEKSVMRTIVKSVPAEALIPIVMKGDTDNPRGFCLILDEDHHPIHVDEQIDFDRELRTSEKGTTETLKVMASDYGLKNPGSQVESPEKMLRGIYNEFTQLIEDKMTDALGDGSYAEKYTLDDDNYLAEIMFFRMLKAKKTRLLFLPAQLVSYITFFRNNAGIGESLVTRSKLLSTLQSALFYAQFLGNLDNSIPRELIEVEMDDEDIDQGKTRDMVINEIIHNRLGSFDWDYRGPNDLMQNLQKKGVQVKFNNVQNGDLPAMNVTQTDVKRDKREIDQAFLDRLGELISMKTGFSHQWVSQSYSPEFSSQVMRDNELTARQIQVYIETLEEALTDRLIKRLINCPVELEEILDKLDKNKEKAMEKLEAALTYLTVTLPSPETAGLELNFEAVENRMKVIDLIVENLIPENIVDGGDEFTSEHLAEVRAIFRAHFVEDYISKDTMFARFIDEMTGKDALKRILDGQGERGAQILKAMAHYTKTMQKADAKAAKVVDGGDPEEEETVDPATNDDDLNGGTGGDEIDPGTEIPDDEIPGDDPSADPQGGDGGDLDEPPLPEL